MLQCTIRPAHIVTHTRNERRKQEEHRAVQDHYTTVHQMTFNATVSVFLYIYIATIRYYGTPLTKFSNLSTLYQLPHTAEENASTKRLFHFRETFNGKRRSIYMSLDEGDGLDPTIITESSLFDAALTLVSMWMD